MKKNFSKKTVVLLAAAAVLLVASTVGSTQAALTYYSETYSAQVTVSSIGVSIVENGEVVGHRNYLQNDTWDEGSTELLADMLADDEAVTLGKEYEEELAVMNSGAIDSYVRVILTKSWQDENGKKDTALSPELIELNLVEGNGWVIDKNASTEERTVLYYTNILPVGETTSVLTDTISINPAVGTKVEQTIDGTNVTYEYAYDGYTFVVEAEVDAVQTHNAADAIKSAWGVDVSVSAGGSLSLQ